jgi:hypothetical protein
MGNGQKPEKAQEVFTIISAPLVNNTTDNGIFFVKNNEEIVFTAIIRGNVYENQVVLRRPGGFVCSSRTGNEHKSL